MKFSVKANTSKRYRRRNAIVIGFVGLLSCFGLVMLIYEFISGKTLFGISYSIAVFLGFTYVIIRVNAVFATYLATDRENLYMKNWENDFLPYNTDCKIKLICEFIPAKTKISEVPLAEISKIVIGTKNFVGRNASGGFAEEIKKFDSSRDYYKKKTVSSMDLFYVETRGGSCCHMPIDRFEIANVTRLVRDVIKRNPNIELKVNSRDYRSLRAK